MSSDLLQIHADDFALFGLPRRHALDRALLDQRRRELQARVHPDRFAAEGAAAQRIAMQWAVRVNEAWQRLKDPLARAAYLCELRGHPVDAQRNTAMPVEFLQRQMAWREALDEAASLPQVQALDAQVAQEECAGFEQLGRLLDGGPGGPDEPGGPGGPDEAGRHDDAAAAAAQVRALMFVARFREDIARRLEAFDEPAR